MKKIIMCILIFLALLAGCSSSGDAPEDAGPEDEESEIVEDIEPTPEDEPVAIEAKEVSDTTILVEYEAISFEYNDNLEYKVTNDMPYIYFDDQIFFYFSSTNLERDEISDLDVEGTITGMVSSLGDTFLNVEVEPTETIKINGSNAYAIPIYAEGGSDPFSGDYYMENIIFLARGSVYTVSFLGELDTYELYYDYYRASVDSIKELEIEYDFIEDTDRLSEMRSYLREYDFSSVIGLADEYIDEHNPADDNSIFEIKEIAYRGLEAVDLCDIVVDGFDNSMSIYYPGVTEISSNINFLPYIQDTTLHVRVGFVKSGWLFFEKTSLKVGEDAFINESHSYFDVTRDVISGSNIMEYVDIKIQYDSAFKRYEQLLSPEVEPILRFTGDGDDAVDHTLTADELEAFKAVFTAARAYTDIIDIIGKR